MGPLATPEIARDLAIGPGLAAAITLGAGGLVAFFLEPWLLLRLQGRPPHRVTAAALAVFAAEMVACAWAPHPLVVVAALLLGGPASGVACSFAQAALAARQRAAGHANAAERATSRWALAAALGDLAAPALLVAVGAGWRLAYLVAAGVAATLAVLVATGGRRTLPPASALTGDGESRGCATGDDDDDATADQGVGPRFTLRELLAARGVLLATLAAAACTFLDEIVLAVGALYLGERFGLPPEERTLVLGAWMVASLAGSFAVTAAVERASAPRLLLGSGLGCALALGAALVTDRPLPAFALLVVAGFLDTWHWPLCQAMALRAAGDRPLLAGAAAALWGPLELAVPFVVAGVVGVAGPAAAMTLLLAQPLAMVAAGLAFGRRPPSSLDTRAPRP